MKRCIWLIWLLAVLLVPTQVWAGGPMLVTKKMEISIGKDVEKAAIKEYGGVVLPDGDPRTQLVQAIGKKLVPIGTRGELNYSFHVLQSKEVNAFACPGGPIYITTGLLDLLEDESELAGILGHEFSHVDREHGRKEINAEIWMKVLAGEAYDHAATAAGMLVIGCGRSREHELQADEYGMRYSFKVGYNPRGFIKALTRLGNKKLGGLDKLIATHPDIPSRTSALEKQLTTDEYKSMPASYDAKPLPWTNQPVADSDKTAEPSLLIHGTIVAPLGTTFVHPRIALLGIRSDRRDRQREEILSVAMIEGKFQLNLPDFPADFMPADANGIFIVVIYDDLNDNKQYDQDDGPTLGNGDWMPLYAREDKADADLIRGWNLIGAIKGEVCARHNLAGTEIKIEVEADKLKKK